MIVCHLNVVRIAVVKPKANPPLIVDGNRIVASPVSFQFMERLLSETFKSAMLVARSRYSNFRTARSLIPGGNRFDYPPSYRSFARVSAKALITPEV